MARNHRSPEREEEKIWASVNLVEYPHCLKIIYPYLTQLTLYAAVICMWTPSRTYTYLLLCQTYSPRYPWTLTYFFESTFISYNTLETTTAYCNTLTVPFICLNFTTCTIEGLQLSSLGFCGADSSVGFCRCFQITPLDWSNLTSNYYILIIRLCFSRICKFGVNWWDFVVFATKIYSRFVKCAFKMAFW